MPGNPPGVMGKIGPQRQRHPVRDDLPSEDRGLLRPVESEDQAGQKLLGIQEHIEDRAQSQRDEDPCPPEAFLFHIHFRDTHFPPPSLISVSRFPMANSRHFVMISFRL